MRNKHSDTLTCRCFFCKSANNVQLVVSESTFSILSQNWHTILRCVMKTIVFLRVARMFLSSCSSVSVSRADVASSKSITGLSLRSALAIAMRCACPSDNPPPCSEQGVSSPSGIESTKSAQLVCSACLISSSVASGFASRDRKSTRLNSSH